MLLGTLAFFPNFNFFEIYNSFNNLPDKRQEILFLFINEYIWGRGKNCHFWHPFPHMGALEELGSESEEGSEITILGVETDKE